MKKNNWRLTNNEVTVLLVNDELYAEKVVGQLYLVNPEKPIYATEVAKLIPKTLLSDGSNKKAFNFQTLNLNISEYKVRLSSELDIEISSDKLPKIYEWYKVLNVCKEEKLEMIASMLESVKSEYLNFEDTFSLMFSEKDLISVKFTNKLMPDHRQALREMTRRLSLEVNKKTSKFEVGYRYEGVDGSMIYLGEVYTYRDYRSDHRFEFNANSSTKVHLYVDELQDGELTIEDVFKNRKIGLQEGDIKTTDKLKMMCRAKQVLTGNAVEDLSIYWEDHVNIAVNRNTVTTDNNYTYCKNISDILNIFEYTSRTSTQTYQGNIKTLVEGMIKLRVIDLILNTWELVSDYYPINSKNIDEVQGKHNIVEKFIQSTELINDAKKSYIPKLLAKVEINLDNVISDAIISWKMINSTRLSSLDEFLKYDRFYTYKFDKYSKNSRQRVKSALVKLEVTTIEQIYGTGELTNALVELSNSARTTFGLGVRNFEVFNTGTLKEKKEFCEFTITLDDLVAHFPQMTPELENEIISKEFVRLRIQADLEELIK